MASGENPFSAMVDVIREEVRRGAGPSWNMGEVISVSPLKVRYRGVQLNADQVAAAEQWAAQLKVGDSVPVLPDRDDGRFAIMQPADSAAFASAEHDHDSDYAALGHDHGSLSSDGKVGTTAGLTVRTGVGGAVEAGCPYDIGDIIATVNTTSPATRWPGTTWTQLKDRMLIGAGNLYTIGTQGGEETHTLTQAEMPSHNHSVGGSYVGTGYTSANRILYSKSDIGGGTPTYMSTYNTGGGNAHNNMPPYEPVNFWKRTA